MTVNLHDHGIDHRIFHVRLVRAGIEYPLEQLGNAPVTKPAKGRAPVAEMYRRITPSTTRITDIAVAGEHFDRMFVTSAAGLPESAFDGAPYEVNAGVTGNPSGTYRG